MGNEMLDGAARGAAFLDARAAASYPPPIFAIDDDRAAVPTHLVPLDSTDDRNAEKAVIETVTKE